MKGRREDHNRDIVREAVGNRRRRREDVMSVHVPEVNSMAMR